MIIEIKEGSNWERYYSLFRCPGAVTLQTALNNPYCFWGDTRAAAIIDGELIRWRVSGFVKDKPCTCVLTEWDRVPEKATAKAIFEEERSWDFMNLMKQGLI